MITGGKDGLLVRMNPKFEVDASMTTPSGIKSLDISDTGKILKVARTLLQGHRVSSNQELRGCATNPTNEHEYATVGDDSAVYVRNLKTKLTVAKTYLQGKLRAIHYSPDGKYLAVGNNNGDIFILKSNDLTQVHFQKYEKMKDMKTKAHGINVLKFSPNGKFLAVGTNDSVIYVWQLSEGFKKMDTLKGHTAVVNYLDWSSHSDHLRSDSGAEVIHWAIPGGSAVKDIKSVEWTSFTCPFNEMNAKDATKNCVDRSPSKTFTVAGDDSSCLTLQAHPSKPAMPYKRYYGHGGAVTSVAFNSNGKYLLSTGSLDGCTFEWKIQKP
ncbi:WD40-repeat-containing domain protein [Chytriomyces sp. MP71]|nr:WD40-repeat-containing domain protein [Chytriomyces sp. MP71]